MLFRSHFTVGIVDDLTHHSLAVDPSFDVESPQALRAVFVGLGSDGTVGANKHTLTIVGDATGLYGQAAFVYDSHKAGTVTISHLRFSPQPIHAAHLIRQAQLLACHHIDLLERFDLLELAQPGGLLLLITPGPPEQVWDQLPAALQQQILERQLRLFGVDAAAIARSHGLGGRINTVMQACFFAVTELMPLQTAMAALRESIRQRYGRKGPAVVEANLAALEAAPAALRPIPIGACKLGSPTPATPPLPPEHEQLLRPLLQHRGDQLPVSALPADGRFPTGTSQWEKRNIGEEVPVWEPDLCIQCGQCVDRKSTRLNSSHSSVSRMPSSA